jgi:hypothetical protein
MADLEEMHQEYQNLIENYKECFTTKAGEKVLEDLQAAYGNRISYSSNPYETAYNEGQRSLYIRITRMLTQRKE